MMATNTKQVRPERTASRPALVPAFTARHGEGAVVLLRQLDLSPLAASIGVSRDGRWVAVSAASRRAGNLSLYDLKDGSVVWRETIDASSADVFATDDGGCIAITRSGRVGAGSTDVHFVGASGQLRASAHLDDKPSEALVVDGAVVVGCRDGQLYRYDLTGALAWRYRVPAHADLHLNPDDPYQRPCPYFVRAPFAGEHILFSSWDRLCMLDRSGAPRWTWQTKTEPTRRYVVPSRPRIASDAHYGLLGVARTTSPDDVRRAFRKKAFETHPDRNAQDPRAAEKFKEAMRAYEAIQAAKGTASDRPFSIGIRIASGPNAISGLAVGDDGSAIAASHDGVLTFLDTAGRVSQRIITGAGGGAVYASGDLTRLVYAHWQGLSFYTPHGLVNVYPTDRLYRVAVRRDGQGVIAWLGRRVLAFDEAGKLLAGLECTKPVDRVAFLADDQVLICAGKLIWLQFTFRSRHGADRTTSGASLAI